MSLHRGQILPTHRSMALELHAKPVQGTDEGRVLLADGSLWGNDLRIHEVSNLALSLADPAS